MILLDFKNPKLWIILCVSLVVFIVLIILFRHFILSRTKARKIVAELERKYEYLHALLVGQDSQLIKRLEIISQSNLLYAEIHDNFQSRFKVILGSNDQQAQIAISSMEELIMQKKYHDFYNNLDNNLRIVELFEVQVKELDNDLSAKLKPEEDCRNASLVLKEKLRRIKATYFEKQAELMSIEDTFTRTFNGIENEFNEYEKYVESAFYDEANNLLPNISKMLDELDYALKELPTLCVLVDATVPEKIEKLQEEYNKMQEQGIPIQHLYVKSCISQMTSELYDIQMRLSSFELKGVKERLTAMVDQIDCFHNLFLEEINAHDTFIEECESIYTRVSAVEHQFVVLRQKLLRVKEIYRLEESYLDKMEIIQNEINQLGATKRQLDTYIHASTKQPYTLLLQKMHELEEKLSATEKDISEYNAYIVSLRTDSDKAFNLVNDSFLQLKKSEKMVRDIGVANYENRLKDRFKQCYEYLTNIYSVLMENPINVKEINRLVSAFNIVFTELTNEIKDQYHLADLAEKAIVEANIERATMLDYDKSLIRAERYFFDGDFEKSYYEANATLKKIGTNNN